MFYFMRIILYTHTNRRASARAPHTSEITFKMYVRRGFSQTQCALCRLWLVLLFILFFLFSFFFFKYFFLFFVALSFKYFKICDDYLLILSFFLFFSSFFSITLTHKTIHRYISYMYGVYRVDGKPIGSFWFVATIFGGGLTIHLPV